MSNAERLIQIYNDANSRPNANERARFIAAACQDDPELKQEVLSLLESHDNAGDFLENSILAPISLITEKPGDTIGRYRLLEKIGEGGFGIVFMAEQQHPVRRRVALKVIKPGMDTRQVIARFEAERQALALMDHPNIARVLDAGATDTGRPYFVMELVKGVPITDYCDKCNLTPEQRLELFVPVCRAVQHAHQKGIIHRDLKPTNVMVTLHDGQPVPKVIDFGIAKATGQQLTEKTLFTNFTQLVGTPLYMSPEQAELSGLDVDTRSDVYSLGVLLYELLTGTTPFDKAVLGKAAYDEVRRIIREEDPPKPSTRISTMGEALSAVSNHRATEPKKLGQFVRGELDCIVMKALEKDRTRRYETADALAADVRHFLEGEPVSARPASAAYRARKFATKHKVGFAAAAAVAAALVLGIIGTTAGLVRARSEKAQAQRESGRATAVSGFLQSVLASARPDAVGGGQDAKVVDLLKWADSRIETELAGQPEAQIQTRYTLYASYCSLGLKSESLASLDRAYTASQQAGMEQAEIGIRVALHKARVDVMFGGTLDASERLARTAAERAQRLLGEDHEVTLFSYGVMGKLCDAAGKTAEADDNYRRLEDGLRRLKSLKMSDAAVAMTLSDYAGVLRSRGEFARAETHCREALTIATAARRRMTMAEIWAFEGLGEALQNQDKWQEAAKVYENALADLRPRVGDAQLKELMNRCAEALRRLGREEDAAKVQQQLTSALTALAAAPASTAAALTNRAELRIRLGQFKDAAADAAQAAELDPKGIFPWYYRGCLLAYLQDESAYRAHCEAMLKQFEHGGPREAERTAKTCLLVDRPAHLERLDAVLDRALARDTGDLRAWDQLAKAMAQYRSGKFEACIRTAGEAAVGLEDAPGKAAAQLFIAMSHQQLKRPDQARLILDEVARYVDKEVPKFGVNGAGSDYSVENWLILHVTLRDAKNLICPTPSTSAELNASNP